MESSHKGGLVKPSEWILFIFATVLLTAAVSNQRTAAQFPAVEAKMDIPIDEASRKTNEGSDVIEAETEIVAVMVKPLTEPAVDLTN